MKKLQVYKQEGCTTTVQKEKMSWLEFLKLQIILYSFSKSCDFLKLQGFVALKHHTAFQNQWPQMCHTETVELLDETNMYIKDVYQ